MKNVKNGLIISVLIISVNLKIVIGSAIITVCIQKMSKCSLIELQYKLQIQKRIDGSKNTCCLLPKTYLLQLIITYYSNNAFRIEDESEQHFLLPNLKSISSHHMGHSHRQARCRGGAHMQVNLKIFLKKLIL